MSLLDDPNHTSHYALPLFFADYIMAIMVSIS